MKSRFLQNSFTSGVLSPLTKGRVDVDQYYQSIEVGENWVIVPQGGIKRRPGTEYIDTALPVMERNTIAPTMPEGGTAANINDENDATSATTTTNIGVVNPYVVAKYNLTTATYIEYVDVRGIFLTVVSATSTEFVVQYSDDDVTYTTAIAVPEITDTAQDFRLKVAGSHRYWRLARVGATDLSTAKITLTEFNLWKKTSTLSNAKTLDFSVESDRHYLLVLTDKNCRIYRTPSTYVADLKTPYTTADLMEVRDVQTENVMIVLHEDYAPQRVINTSDAIWTIDDVPFANIPQFDYDDASSPTPTSDVQDLVFTGTWPVGQKFQIDVEGVISKSITFAGDATADERSSTAFNIQKNLQDMPVFGQTGVSVTRTGVLTYRITVAGESAKDFELFSGYPTTGAAADTIVFTKVANGVPRKEDVWSSTRGYPKAGCFYGGRLWFGGTRSKPQSLFGSKAADFFNFEIGEGDDDDAIFITISSRKLNDIVDIYPGRDLQVFTSGSEFTVTGSPITPTTVGTTPQTSHGARSIEVKDVDGATVFADRNGKTIREYIYSFNEDAYISYDISVLASHLIKVPADIAMLTGTASEDANWLFIVNNDGGAAVLNKLRSQDINGFTEWTTQGFITNASVVDDELYMINKRTIGGVESYFVERWSFDYLMDNSIKKTVAATVTGLDHLEGHTVQIVADGAVLPERAVSGGAITLTTSEQAHLDLEIGINFVPRLIPMPVNTNAGSGQNVMRIKKIIRLNARVYNTFGLYIDGQAVPIRSFGEADSTLGDPPSAKTGIVEDFLPVVGWTRETMPEFTVPDPTPCHIQSIDYEVESS